MSPSRAARPPPRAWARDLRTPHEPDDDDYYQKPHDRRHRKTSRSPPLDVEKFRRDYLELQALASRGRRVPERVGPVYSFMFPGEVLRIRTPTPEALKSDGPPRTILKKARHDLYDALGEELKMKRDANVGLRGWGEGSGSERPVADGEVEVEETGGVDWLAMMAEEIRGDLADGVRCTGQSYWIHKLHKGLDRIPNDDFDHIFHVLTRESPSIWDDEHLTFIHNAMPVPVHSHNDYTRRIPLFEALGSGCISVEADVHLIRGDLLVGHSSRGLKSTSNLRTMYLEPLQRMLERQNPQGLALDSLRHGIFDEDPRQTVVLLIDHKTAGEETFAELHSQLQPLRELDYLTYWNGSEKVMRPLTVVATGKAPFDSVMALSEAHRDIFWDAPLDALPSALDNFTTDPPSFRYNQSNSHYASTQYRNAVVWRPMDLDGSLPTAQGKDLAATQAEQAAARGLLTRYWDAPISPPNLRDSIWRWQVGAGTGVINMDDMGVVRDKGSGWGRARDLMV